MQYAFKLYSVFVIVLKRVTFESRSKPLC